MSEREAAVKLTLDDGQYLGAMRKVGDETARAVKKSTASVDVFGKSVQAAQKHVTGLGGAASKATGLVTGLFAGITAGSAIKNTIELETKFKQLGFRVGRATQGMLKASDVQRRVEQSAALAGKRTVEMAEAYDQLFTATGDADFAGDAIDTVGEMAQATGTHLEVLTSLADQLHTKFGVTAEELGDVFAQVFDAAQQGGPSLEEFASVASTMGAELLQAGLDGRRGLDFMLGSLVKTDDEMKNLGAQVKGVKQLLMSLGDKSQIKTLAKTLAIDPALLLNEKDLIGRLRRVLSLGKRGVDALKGSMKEAEEQKALRILFTDPFEQALKEANASGIKGKAAIDRALGVLDEQIEGFGKSTMTGADIQKEAADRMQDPAARLAIAVEKMERAIAQPAVLKALDELSQYLPGVAEGFAQLVAFIAKNPLLSGTAALAGKGALSFGSDLVSEAVQKAFAVAVTEGAVSGKGRGGGAVSALARAADPGSALAAHIAAGGMGGLTKAMADGSKEARAQFMEAFLGGASVLSNAIRVASVAAAAAWAYEVGKEQIDNTFSENASATNELAGADAGALDRSGGIAKQKAQAERLRKAIARRKEESGSFWTNLFDMGPSGANELDVNGNPVFDRSGSLKGQADTQIAEAEKTLREKEAHIEALELFAKNRAAVFGPAAGADDAAIGKAVAEYMKRGNPLPVHVTNDVRAFAGMPPQGPGGSRGARPPPPARPGGGT